MDKTAKRSILKMVAKIGERSASIGCNSASVFGFHQPKEPVNIKAQFDAIRKK
jgi:cyclic lactone autoinducer peptide